MYYIAKRRQTSKRMYFLSCRDVNSSKNSVTTVRLVYTFNRVTVYKKFYDRSLPCMALSFSFTEYFQAGSIWKKCLFRDFPVVSFRQKPLCV